MESNYQKRKVSGLVVVFNEELSVDLAVRSFCDYVDEIVVMDGGSTDSTLEKIRSLNKPVRIYDCRNLVLHECLELGRRYCNGEYVFRMDGDEVLSEGFVTQFYRCIEEEVDVVFSRIVVLWGDYEHTLRDLTIMSYHPRVFRKSEGIYYYHNGICDSLYCREAKKSYVHNLGLFNLKGLKPVSRLFRRAVWHEWVRHVYPRMTLQEYSASFTRDDELRWFKAFISRELVRYDSNKYVSLPKIVVENCNRFPKMIYKNGKIVGREDVGDLSSLENDSRLDRFLGFERLHR